KDSSLDHYGKLEETWVGIEETKKTGRGLAVKIQQIYVKPLYGINLWKLTIAIKVNKFR
ncbi:unnamed protein product, partial [Brachionus calyciflorus]